MPLLESEAPSSRPTLGCLPLLLMLFALFCILSQREPTPVPVAKSTETGT